MYVVSVHTRYSWLPLSRPRLSRITAYLEVKIWPLPKHENLTRGKKILWRRGEIALRSNFSSFPQYFQYISNLRVQLHIYLSNVVVRIIFSSILQIWYVEVRICWSISESPLEFEITRVSVLECMKSCVYGTYWGCAGQLCCFPSVLLSLLSLQPAVKCIFILYPIMFLFIQSVAKIYINVTVFSKHSLYRCICYYICISPPMSLYYERFISFLQ